MEEAVRLKRKSGRPKGVPNKTTGNIRALALMYAPSAIISLYKLSKTAKSEQVRVLAAEKLLDRAVGKAAQHTTIAGDQANPLLIGRADAAHMLLERINGIASRLEPEAIEDARDQESRLSADSVEDAEPVA